MQLYIHPLFNCPLLERIIRTQATAASLIQFKSLGATHRRVKRASQSQGTFCTVQLANDIFIAELTFLEESLLKQAEEEANMKEKNNYAESEVERIAELRRKGRGKGKHKTS